MIAAVLFDHEVDGVHVRNRYLPVAFDEDSCLLRLHSSEKAQVDEHTRRCATHTSCTVDIDLPPVHIDHSVQLNSCPVDLRDQISLVEVMDREVDCFDSSLFIVP